MALFGKKKKEVVVEALAITKSEQPKKVSVALPENPGAVLLRPRLTEKGALLSEGNVYAFNVRPNATKHEIAKAVASAFKVTPVSVRVVRIPRKKTLTRQTGKVGQTKGGKKAYVRLKEGDKIELV